LGRYHIAKDETGSVYGNLSVITRAGTIFGHAVWLCRCSCGKEVRITGDKLRRKNNVCCGCLRVARGRKLGRGNTQHGLCRDGVYTHEYALWHAARVRAKKKGLEFSIKPSDIHVPEFCPLRGVLMVRGRYKANPNSPSLDRIDSSKGYTADNIWVISNRANMWKSNFSLTELRRMVNILGERISQ
jgi:hypothetical protein